MEGEIDEVEEERGEKGVGDGKKEVMDEINDYGWVTAVLIPLKQDEKFFFLFLTATPPTHILYCR